MPNKPNLTNKSEALVQRVRKRFLEEYKKNVDDYEEEDVKMIAKDDWLVKRYVIARFRHEDNALQMLIDSYKWRKSYGLRQMRDNYFPVEFYATGGIFSYLPDRNGNQMIYMRVKMAKRIADLSPYVKKYLAHTFNKIDQKANGNGWVLVFDCSDTTIVNADVDLLFFIINTLKNYFPAGLDYILVYELPWILQAAWNLGKTWVPPERRKLVRFANKNDITEFVAPENLPDCFPGGTSTMSYRTVPDGCPSAMAFGQEVAKLSYDRIENMIHSFKPHLKDVIEYDSQYGIKYLKDLRPVSNQ